ncbi:MAG: hypothetical protein AB7Q27_22845 [Acidimicrobiia bacterium]
MSRFDDPTLYNPYGWRLADLDDPTTTPQRRRELIEDLLVWEAEELAHGLRHLTIVHGSPDSLVDCCHLDTFYETLRAIVAATGWVRVRGTAEHVTITVRGADAEERINAFVTAAEAANPGPWTVVRSPRPPITRS